jgi:hypothetical protein
MSNEKKFMSLPIEFMEVLESNEAILVKGGISRDISELENSGTGCRCGNTKNTGTGCECLQALASI